MILEYRLGFSFFPTFKLFGKRKIILKFPRDPESPQDPGIRKNFPVLTFFQYSQILWIFGKFDTDFVSLAAHSQSRLNSFQTVKTLFLHCFTWTSRLHFFSRLCPIFGMRQQRSKADEILVIVET